MSPEAIATDHVYRRLKTDIMAGHHAPASTLNVHQIALAIGVSISPVRDAMERLVGERLLAARTGGGFQMPDVTEGSLRSLYLWHGHLARGIVRAGVTPDLPGHILNRLAQDGWHDDESIASATAAFFQVLGGLADNEEHRVALRAAGERLHAARLREGRFLRDRDHELKRLVMLSVPGSEPLLRGALGSYHRRRIRYVAGLCEALFHRAIK